MRLAGFTLRLFQVPKSQSVVCVSVEVFSVLFDPIPSAFSLEVLTSGIVSMATHRADLSNRVRDGVPWPLFDDVDREWKPESWRSVKRGS